MSDKPEEPAVLSHMRVVANDMERQAAIDWKSPAWREACRRIAAMIREVAGQ